MTNPEPAGAGTAESIAAEIVAKHLPAWASIGVIDDPEYFLGIVGIELRKAIASAITAAESRATERCAKIAEEYLPATATNGYPGERIAARIRSSINPSAK